MTLTIPARPFDFKLDPGQAALVVIDMQRDFVEPGGFGASLGNDVSLLHSAIEPIATLLAQWRARAWPVLHTRECHRPDLSDCPPAKRLRGEPSLRIGDVGPMGRLLVAGSPGADNHFFNDLNMLACVTGGRRLRFSTPATRSVGRCRQARSRHRAVPI